MRLPPPSAASPAAIDAVSFKQGEPFVHAGEPFFNGRQYQLNLRGDDFDVLHPRVQIVQPLFGACLPFLQHSQLLLLVLLEVGDLLLVLPGGLCCLLLLDELCLSLSQSRQFSGAVFPLSSDLAQHRLVLLCRVSSDSSRA